MRVVGIAALACAACGTFGAAEDPKVDASAPDPVDGGGSPADGGGGGSGFCASRSGFAFCDDFDKGGAAGEGWTTENVVGGGMKLLDPATSTSAPSSLRLQIPVSAKNGAFAYLSRRVDKTPWPPSRFEFSMYLRPQSWSVATDAAIAALRCSDAFDQPVLDAYVVIAEGYSGIAVAVDDAYVDTPKAAVLPVNEWVRMVLEVDPIKTNVAPVRLFANGAKLIDARVTVPDTVRTPTHFYVSIGPRSINTTPALDINYDDVLFETK